MSADFSRLTPDPVRYWDRMGSMRPMLASHGPTPGVPDGDEWVHEVKWDGIRLMVDKSDGQLRLLNRNGGDVTMVYPELHAGAAQLPDDVLIDGEVVVVNADGTSNLAALMPRIHLRDPVRINQLASARPAQFMAFDLLRLAGRPLIGEPLEVRRDLLEHLDLGALGSSWQCPDQYDDGQLLAEVTAQAGLEGVVSKRRGSLYRPGARGLDWIKVPHRTEFVGVIGGWVGETDSPNRLGSLWIGHPHDEPTFDQTGELYLITRAGSGIGHGQRDDLLSVLRDIEIDHCPFVPPPVGPELARTRWVEPIVCVQVRYLGGRDAFSREAAAIPNEAGQLRQPVLRRLRPDLTPLETPSALLDEE